MPKRYLMLCSFLSACFMQSRGGGGDDDSRAPANDGASVFPDAGEVIPHDFLIKDASIAPDAYSDADAGGDGGGDPGMETPTSSPDPDEFELGAGCEIIAFGDPIGGYRGVEFYSNAASPGAAAEGRGSVCPASPSCACSAECCGIMRQCVEGVERFYFTMYATLKSERGITGGPTTCNMRCSGDAKDLFFATTPCLSFLEHFVNGESTTPPALDDIITWGPSSSCSPGPCTPKGPYCRCGHTGIVNGVTIDPVTGYVIGLTCIAQNLSNSECGAAYPLTVTRNPMTGAYSIASPLSTMVTQGWMGLRASCTSSWSCTVWSACSCAGTRTRSCVDLNFCGTSEGMPSTSSTCEPCGNGSCDCGETCSSCSMDCGSCSPPPPTCSCTDGDVDGHYATSCADLDCSPRDDCNNSNAAIHPGAAEVCNSVDSDCDGNISEGPCSLSNATSTCSLGACIIVSCSFGYSNCDGAASNGCEVAGLCGPICGDGICAGSESCATCSADCATPEVCDSVDNDCDGVVDEGSNACGGACVLSPSYGASCDGPDGDLCADDSYVCAGANSVTCSTGATNVEICNSLDDDCDGAVDEGLSCGPVCGNSICEVGETCVGCAGDCVGTTSCTPTITSVACTSVARGSTATCNFYGSNFIATDNVYLECLNITSAILVSSTNIEITGNWECNCALGGQDAAYRHPGTSSSVSCGSVYKACLTNAVTSVMGEALIGSIVPSSRARGTSGTIEVWGCNLASTSGFCSLWINNVSFPGCSAATNGHMVWGVGTIGSSAPLGFMDAAVARGTGLACSAPEKACCYGCFQILP